MALARQLPSLSIVGLVHRDTMAGLPGNPQNDPDGLAKRRAHLKEVEKPEAPPVSALTDAALSTLRQQMATGTDWDVAAFNVAAALGALPDGAQFGTYKPIFWTDNALCSSVQVRLKELCEAGILAPPDDSDDGDFVAVPASDTAAAAAADAPPTADGVAAAPPPEEDETQ